MPDKAIGALCHDLVAAFRLDLYDIREKGICLDGPGEGPHGYDHTSGAEPLQPGRHGGPTEPSSIETHQEQPAEGEHDMSDNIVHLVLARPQGAGPGTKGISLFIVPKVHFDWDSGELVVRMSGRQQRRSGG
jgi:hypothetical protein